MNVPHHNLHSHCISVKFCCSATSHVRLKGFTGTAWAFMLMLGDNFSHSFLISFPIIFCTVIPPVVLFSGCGVLVWLMSHYDSRISGPSRHVVDIVLNPLEMKVD